MGGLNEILDLDDRYTFLINEIWQMKEELDKLVEMAAGVSIDEQVDENFEAMKIMNSAMEWISSASDNLVAAFSRLREAHVTTDECY